MDKGAHFYKCDFQVHTPRDINWQGASAVSREERIAYSESLVRACRLKGIHAIAITDHHDFVFFPYIRSAAASELDDAGDPIRREEQLVVFPGLELTFAAPPCQALLLLDSTFPDNLLPSILTLLSITTIPDTESKSAGIVAIPQTVADSFKALYERLNSLDHVRDRFILLPQCNERGSKSLLRSGFYDYYKTMPCVGGYLDGPVSQLGNGNRDIINGKNREYGFKSIAVIQTSDNRKATHEDLGQYTTWIKWAEPSAEALRQACLAQDSRISQDIPVLPPVFITTLDVSNSKFLGRIHLSFNQQYNAVIGGRGTGKSTVLEYLRWGLCDQCPDLSDEGDDLPNYQARRKNLIDKTLLPFDATVQVSFMKNEIPHVVRRKASTGEMLLKIGNGEFESCTEDNIRNLLPIQAYSQKQLSSVGVSKVELQRLVYSPIRQALSESSLSFKNLQSDLRTSYEKRRQIIDLQRDVKRNDVELKSITEQVEKLRKNLKGVSDEDRATIETHEGFSVAAQLVEGWMSELGSASDSIGTLIDEFENSPTPIPLELTLPSSLMETITKINTNVTEMFTAMRKELNEMKERISEDSVQMTRLKEERNTWIQTLERHNQNYSAAKERSSSQQVTLNEISKLEQRGKEIRKSVAEKRQLINKLGDQEQAFSDLADQWILAHKERADLVQEQCAQLTVLSDNNLRVTLGRGAGIDKVHSTLRNLSAGSNLRKEKIESICNSIASSQTPVQKWHELLNELELLASFDLENDLADNFPHTPKLSAIGLMANDLKKVAEKLNSSNFIDLYLIQLEDIPIFEYKTREGEYIPFVDASAGQQATSLIQVLLNQEGPSLIIDQPEDDLDNQMVSEIAQLICKSKKKRQIIFTSHNANIVVNGDAELVACCDYKTLGDQSNGEITKEGAIDIGEIRTEITKIMEGGEKAFRLRKEKYGF